MTSTNTSSQPQGPPYLPQAAALGGQPTPSVDDPISAVLLLFFIAGAAFHMTVFQINRRRDHKFIMSVLTFGFCMARIVALVLRIAWASRLTNISLAIAANVFTAAGVVILFIVNLIFAQRIVRAYHPKLGWHTATRLFFRFLFFSVVAMLVMVITVTVQSFYTLDANTRRIDRDIQLFAQTFLAALAFLPIPITLFAWLTPRDHPIEKFGQGRFRTKITLLLVTSTLLTLGAGFRVGVAYDIRPITQPAWFHHKACYYIFNYVIELIVVYLYGLSRFDRRFHVPNGASAPGHYAAGQALEGKGHTLSDRINAEADVFGDDGGEQVVEQNQENREREWEERARKEQEAGESV
jgi:hypothetical protein